MLPRLIAEQTSQLNFLVWQNRSPDSDVSDNGVAAVLTLHYIDERLVSVVVPINIAQALKERVEKRLGIPYFVTIEFMGMYGF